MHALLQAHQSPGELLQLWRSGKASLIFVAFSWMLGQVGQNNMQQHPMLDNRCSLCAEALTGGCQIRWVRRWTCSLGRSSGWHCWKPRRCRTTTLPQPLIPLPTAQGWLHQQKCRTALLTYAKFLASSICNLHACIPGIPAGMPVKTLCRAFRVPEQAVLAKKHLAKVLPGAAGTAPPLKLMVLTRQCA